MPSLTALPIPISVPVPGPVSSASRTARNKTNSSAGTSGRTSLVRSKLCLRSNRRPLSRPLGGDLAIVFIGLCHYVMI